MDSEDIIKSIQERLLQSGEHAKITHQLQELLKQAGWYDDVNAMALEELSGQREPNLDQTSAKIQQKAMAMVPDQIKLEILQKIREFVNSNVESAP